MSVGRPPARLPSPLPHVLGLQSMYQRSSLCKPIVGDTERKLQIVTKLLFFFFFFPNGIQQHAIIIQIENYLNLSSLVCLQWYFNMSPSVTEIHKAFIQMKFEGTEGAAPRVGTLWRLATRSHAGCTPQPRGNQHRISVSTKALLLVGFTPLCLSAGGSRWIP